MKPGRESDQVLLEHIQECIERIREYTNGYQKSSFDGSPLVQDAVIRNLQPLAESTQRLRESLKNTEKGIPWRAIAGFRNVLTHAYLDVDLRVVWSVVEKDLPKLAHAVERMTRAPGSPQFRSNQP